MTGPAFTELRENLREAAERDLAARRARSRRRRRRTGGLLAVVLFGGAAAAGASGLISSGSPVKDTRPSQDLNRPNNDPRKLSVVAHDGKRVWGVSAYTARNGQQCVIAGRVNGTALGQYAGDQFHQYPLDFPAACRKLGTRGKLDDVVQREDRTLFYGRVGPGIKHISFVYDGQPKSLKPGPNGAFLFVFSRFDPAKLKNLTFS